MITLDQLGAATVDEHTGEITFERTTVPGATAGRWIAALQQLTEPTQDPFRYVERDYRILIKSREIRLGDSSFLDTIVDIGGSIADWLAAIRTYSDHTKRRLKEEESAQFNNFSSAERHEYDAYLGYRFCARLRNYSQHFMLPIHHIELTEDYASVLVDRDLLLKNYDGWITVRREIEVLDWEFPIYPMIDEAMVSLRRINAQIAIHMTLPPSSVISSYDELRDHFLNRHPGCVPFLYSVAGASLEMGSELRYDMLYAWPLLDQLVADMQEAARMATEPTRRAVPLNRLLDNGTHTPTTAPTTGMTSLGEAE